MDRLTLTVGPTDDGRKMAVVTSGGHPQRPGSGTCNVCTVEDVTGWSRSKVKAWFRRMQSTRPWETRQ